MSSNRSKEIHLANRPTGFPDDTNFIVKEVDLTDPNTDEVLVKNLWMSVDPYMRGRMIDRKSYVPPFQIDQVLEGGAIGIVEKSNSSNLNEGDYVMSNYGWREYFVTNENNLKVIKKSKKILEASVLPIVMNVNPRSIYNKVLEFHDFVKEEGIDCVLMSESWERPDEPLEAIIDLPDHIVISNPHQRKEVGGRPAIIVNSK